MISEHSLRNVLPCDPVSTWRHDIRDQDVKYATGTRTNTKTETTVNSKPIKVQLYDK
jgi:hypothetical protein